MHDAVCFMCGALHHGLLSPMPDADLVSCISWSSLMHIPVLVTGIVLAQLQSARHSIQLVQPSAPRIVHSYERLTRLTYTVDTGDGKQAAQYVIINLSERHTSPERDSDHRLQLATKSEVMSPIISPKATLKGLDSYTSSNLIVL